LFNRTDGGEIVWLYSLTELYNKILPSSVCPYIEQPGYENEWKCDNYSRALEKNPLKLSISTMHTGYNVRDTKQIMYDNKRPVGWSANCVRIAYYFPCVDWWATQPICNETWRVRCMAPSQKEMWCARVELPQWTVNGEFVVHGDASVEGGHAMNIVGYNDKFVSDDGFQGGFIIKNSWLDVDAPFRAVVGTHSIAWWMQEVSDWAERVMCPNPTNPGNWGSCVNEKYLAPNYQFFVDYNHTCLDDKWMHHFVETYRQPTEFICNNDSWCNTSSEIRYFLDSKARLQGEHDYELMQVCMLEYNNITQEAKHICLPTGVPPEMVSWMFSPVKWQLDYLVNDPDVCGFWLIPYHVVERMSSFLVPGEFFSTHMDITWDDQSYVANAATNPGLDYSWIKASTFVQKNYTFAGPFAFDNQRYRK